MKTTDVGTAFTTYCAQVYSPTKRGDILAGTKIVDCDAKILVTTKIYGMHTSIYSINIV